ncbi:hypothetical protein H8B13_20485 [Hymenobacter sp. BT188]|uniref:hypothetical protein n=1 Tax=Hymenobacter TaxID=89966 RepID=UPI0010591892|nr:MULTISPECIES: hypothetical protein [Hymenobacter]MBC6609208.1 hypothetical protein [Hymenobacter sp. BT188]QIL78150.1 hypothetical protein G7064_20180 [Hymenobacter sp. HDW8]
MTRSELEAAGFIYADYLPQGTRYAQGDLYVLLTPAKTVRLYLPDASDVVEIATGDLFTPDVHYQGPIQDMEELLRFVHGALR